MRLPRPITLRFALPLALTLVSTSRALAGVTVVAPAGGDFATIHAAIAAVPEGEILLVRTGSYPAFAITNKSVHVIADAGAQVEVHDSIQVQNLAANQRVTLQGLRVLTGAFQATPGLSFANCAGPIRAQSLRVDTTIPSPSLSSNPPGIVIVGCTDVALEQCVANGIQGTIADLFWTPPPPSPALDVGTSTVAVHGGTYRGGRGNFAYQTPTQLPATPGARGAPGIHIGANGTVFLQGAQVAGGAGGDGWDSDSCSIPYGPTRGGDGGAGLGMIGVNSVTVLATVFTGGAAGFGGTGSGGCNSPNGATGPAVTGGTVTTLPGATRWLRLVQPAREGDMLQLQFEGLPGDQVFLALAAGRQHVFDPILNGTLLVLPPFRRFLLGSIPGTGVLDVELPVNELGVGVEGLLRQAQGIFLDAGGVRWTSGVSTVTMLDASF